MASKCILAIDAGNSSTTIALYNGCNSSVAAKSSVRGGISAARGDCAIAIRKAFAAADAAGCPVEAAMLASVTPAVNVAWQRLVSEEAGLSLAFVRHDMPLPFKFGYPNAETTGADRIADMAAMAVLYGGPAMIVDIGTAVTYDLLSADGVFFTGVIGPGPEILARSLHDYTAQLPLLEWWRDVPPERPEDTAGAMLYGINAGFAGALHETVARLKPLLGATLPHLVATGGFAQRFAAALGDGFSIDPDITIKGVGILAGGDWL